MSRSKMGHGTHQPESVFDWDLGPEDEVRRWLEMAPFDDRGVLHLPEYAVVKEVEHRLKDLAKRDELSAGEVLAAYHKLHGSASSSDLVCGVTVGGEPMWRDHG